LCFDTTMPGRGRRFRPGQSGNPAGRPRGAKDRVPRLGTSAATLLRHAMASAFEPDLSELSRTIQAGLRDPRRALGFLQLGARLNGEIGRRVAEPQQVSVVVVGPGAEAIAA